MKKVAVIGSKGKMGELLCSELGKEYDVIGIDKDDSLMGICDADFVVDFSTGTCSARVASLCAKYGKSLVIGATGQTKSELKLIDKASEKIAIVKSGNFSLGIFKIKQLINALVDESIDSILVLEKHHKNKKDKPSGTAIMLGELLSEKTSAKIDMLSIRGGKEIGTHEISFYYEDELIKVTHQAFSRKAFVKGVLYAIKFLESNMKPELYDFEKL